MIIASEKSGEQNSAYRHRNEGRSWKRGRPSTFRREIERDLQDYLDWKKPKQFFPILQILVILSHLLRLAVYYVR